MQDGLIRMGFAFSRVGGDQGSQFGLLMFPCACWKVDDTRYMQPWIHRPHSFLSVSTRTRPDTEGAGAAILRQRVIPRDRQ